MSDTLHQERSYVGEEFLTWLWWQCETGGGTFDLPGGGSISMAIEDNLVFRGDLESEPEGVLRGGVPTRSREAAAALASGKRLGRAKLVLATHDREWTATFDATTYQFSGVSVPQPDAEDDPDVEAFLGFEELAEAIDALFGDFVGRRLSKTFVSETLPEMQAWIQTKDAQEVASRIRACFKPEDTENQRTQKTRAHRGEQL